LVDSEELFLEQMNMLPELSVGKLYTTLYDCNASNQVLENLKHDKIWETFCISVPHSKFWGLGPCMTQIFLHPRLRRSTDHWVCPAVVWCHRMLDVAGEPGLPRWRPWLRIPSTVGSAPMLQISACHYSFIAASPPRSAAYRRTSC